jgi:hypothetical protein
MAIAVAGGDGPVAHEGQRRTPRTASSKEDFEMRKTLATVALAASLVLAPLVARADSPEHEVGYSALAAVSNLWYFPAKVTMAAVGLPLGAAAGFLNGGDTRASYAFWVPMVGGAYFLTSDHIDGDEPFEFFGRDYADRPGQYGRTHHGGAAYDAGYVRR